jgi:hypothetical protein
MNKPGLQSPTFKGVKMSDPKKPELTEDQKKRLMHLKLAHDYYATAIELIEIRCTFRVEEFQGVANTVAFLRNLLGQCKADIYELEPPVEKAPEKPYNMDLTHVKPKLEAVGEPVPETPVQ